jgi:hypothetical protein
VLTVTVPRQYRLDPSDTTVVQTRPSEYHPWRPFSWQLDADDAFHACFCLRLREVRAQQTIRAAS